VRATIQAVALFLSLMVCAVLTCYGVAMFVLWVIEP
jgi:hypothetical protein